MSIRTINHNLQIIGWNELNVGDFVGHGSYGAVYQGSWKDKKVAIKQLLLKTMPERLAQDFENETKIMAECQCDQVVKLYAVCKESGHFAMIMEYMDKGSLYHVLHDDKTDLSWDLIRPQIAIDIGKGLSFLHQKNILHRDLKSPNVLLGFDFHAKLTDFGLSKIKVESNSAVSAHPAAQSVGTARWYAPELTKRGAKHSKATDVYSYGMVLWEIASRMLPFQDEKNEQLVISWIKDGEQENIPEDCPASYAEWVKKAWIKNPDDRPTAKEIYEGLETSFASQPQKPSWYYDPNTKSLEEAKGKDFVLVAASEQDVAKVVACYSRFPIPGYQVKSVKLIFNPKFDRGFELYMDKLNARHGNKKFEPKWSMNLSDQQLKWRKQVFDIFKQATMPYIDPKYPHVKLVPLWHGTDQEALTSICKIGYANLGSTDQGFFGQGIYSSLEPKYAFEVYSKGALIFNWAAIYSPFPFILGDDPNQHSGSHDARFIPVVPRNPNNPHEANFDPCPPNTSHTYCEIVLPESTAILPRYVVELEKDPLSDRLPAIVPPKPKVASPVPVVKVEAKVPKPKLVTPPSSSGTYRDPSSSESTSSIERTHKNNSHRGSSAKSSSSPMKKRKTLPVDEIRARDEYERGLLLHYDQKKPKQAIEHYQIAADLGHALAQKSLGYCYFKGEGIKKDLVKALEYSRLAADQGIAEAGFNVGYIYHQRKEYEEAAKYYKQAADGGNASAQYEIAQYYEKGRGVGQDFALAGKYFQMAVDNGRTKDDSQIRAIDNFEKGAKNGSADSKYGLGMCYALGKGKKQNIQTARTLLNAAANSGHKRAIIQLKKLNSY